MMAMYGEPLGEGTVSHEVGHIYSYGMLANNEWREGWMDEGLTSYQSEWRIRGTPQDFAEGAPRPHPAPATGYRAHAHVMSSYDRGRMQLYDVDLLGRAQAPEPPIVCVQRVQHLPDGRLLARRSHVRDAPRHARRQHLHRVSARLLRAVAVQTRGRAGDARERGAGVGARSRMVFRAVGASHGAGGLRAQRCRSEARRRWLDHAREADEARRVSPCDAGRCAHGARMDDRAWGSDARRPVGGSAHGREAVGCCASIRCTPPKTGTAGTM